MKKILVIGATSSIAENAARFWAKAGCSLFLVARSQERLDAITKDLIVRGAVSVNGFCMDLTQFDQQETMLNMAYAFLGEIDVALIAHGTLSNQAACESSPQITLQEISVNALSVISLLTLLANHFEEQKTGFIAVISSVAGDRGRQSNYVYGSAKAMVSAFTSGLRQRLAKSNVFVLTVKPGYVDTPMTREYPKGPLWEKPQVVASQIVQACNYKGGILYVPRFWWAIMAIIKLIPETIFMKLKL
jgi:decaprenylphospho-beta-D-erythro-pentofuranosid-2-ulose 2-reductase